MIVVGLGAFDFVPEALRGAAPFERAALSNLSYIYGQFSCEPECFDFLLPSENWRLDKIFEDQNSWILKDEETTAKPLGFCGRRLLVPVGANKVVCMDKIFGNPHELFGVSPQPATAAKLFDISFFDGEFIERDLGRPKVSPYGKRIEQIFEEDVLYWHPESEPAPSFG